MLEWSYFPKTDPLPDFLKESVDVFEKNFHLIDSFNDTEEKYVQNSDTVLKILSKEFQNLEFQKMRFDSCIPGVQPCVEGS